MPDESVRVAMVVGADDADKRGIAVARWLAGQACRRTEADVDVIDLATACLPVMSPGVLADAAAAPHAVCDLAPWLEAADGFVVVAHGRRHGADALITEAVAWCGEAWKAKPVALVVHGVGAASSAAERLRPVLSAAHAVTIHETLRIDGGSEPIRNANARCDGRPEHLLGQLFWWARVLRRGRTDSPYPY